MPNNKIIQEINKLSQEELKSVQKYIDVKLSEEPLSGTIIVSDGYNEYLCSSIADTRKTIQSITGKLPDRSNVYKALNGKIKTIYGLTVTKIGG